MDNLAADFIIDLTEPLQAEYNLEESNPINCTFEVYASGTVWGSISGDINNQTDLIELIENNYNGLEGQITALDTKVDNNYNELSNGLIETNQDILDLTNTVNSNFTTLNNKIDEINADLSTDISELNTAIQNEATTRAENDTLLQNNINTLSQTVTANYNTLDGKIDTEISDRTIADTTLQGNIDTLSGTVTNNYNALDARITTNTGNISDINTTLSGYGNIVTHNVSEFATSAQGTLADTALQPNDNISELVNDVGYITSASLPTDYVPETRTINGYALSSNITLNYTDVGALSASTTINDLTTIAQQNALNSGATTTNIGQITTNANNISDIQDLIPNQATSSNQLADKSFVNSSIATNTANFIGTFNSVAELEAYTGTLTNNDYAFVATTDAVGNTLYDRYKWNGSEWLFEYELNNSSFTAQQWASINSGATSTNIGQITINANNIADLQTNKQDVLTAGANVQINNNVISATDTTYTAGTGISIVNGVISNTQTSAEWGNIQGTLSNQTDLQNALDTKQNTISDLSTIRSGAALGATALQPNDNITELVNNAGYITGITSSDVTTALGYTPYNATNPNGYITASALTGYATETWVGNQGYITGITSSDVTAALGYTPLSNATKYGSSLSYSSNVLQLLDQDGNSLGNSVTIQSSPDIDSITITKNTDDELQTIAVIDQNNTSNAIKTWTGTKAQYDAIVTKNSTTLYFLSDVGKIYFGDTLISNVGNNTLLDFKWADHQLNDIQWLRADTFSWQSGSVYITAYNHLVADIDGITAETETIGSYTVTFYRATDGHKICLADQEQTVLNIYNTYGIAWYYILDTTNTQFKLPRTKYGFEGLRTNVGDNINESLPNNNAPVQERATQMYLYFYVGDYTQSAVEQTAGLNSELFNGKADINLSNINNTAKVSIAHNSMPSTTKYIDLVIANNTDYQAPADGYFVIYMSNNTIAGNNSGVSLYNTTTPIGYGYFGYTASAYAQEYRGFVPCKKGEYVHLKFARSVNNYQVFRFVYAVGSESEAS